MIRDLFEPFEPVANDPPDPAPPTQRGQAAVHSPEPALQQLLDSTPALWRGSDITPQRVSALATGHPQLDRLLPAGGWPRSGLVDIISRQAGMGELQLLMPLLRSLSQQNKPMLWITPPHRLYAPALLQAGVDTRHIILIQPEDSCQQALWSTEKALQSNQCALVLVWQNWFSARVMRRLQMAARSGNTPGILFHQRPIQQSPASLQLQLQGVQHTQNGRMLEVSLLKAQGSQRRGRVRLPLDA